MRYVLLALLLTGCATGPRADLVMFDRGSFALSYADYVSPSLAKCAHLKATASQTSRDSCEKLHALDAQIRQAIIDAPKAAAAQQSPFDQLMPLIIKLAPLIAAGL